MPKKLIPDVPELYGYYPNGTKIMAEWEWSSTSRAQMIGNAKYLLWYFFTVAKWSYQACIGMIGNMYEESYITPTQRERIWKDGQWTGEYGNGFGLIQWTGWDGDQPRLQTYLDQLGYSNNPVRQLMDGSIARIHTVELPDDLRNYNSYWRYAYNAEWLQPFIIPFYQYREITDIEIAAKAYDVCRERQLSGTDQEADEAALQRRVNRANTVDGWLSDYYDPNTNSLSYDYGTFPIWLFKKQLRRLNGNAKRRKW